MDNKIIVQLSRLFRARFPYLYITTWEEERALSLIKRIAKSEKLIRVTRDVYTWTQTNGFVLNGQKIEGIKNKIVECDKYKKKSGEK